MQKLTDRFIGGVIAGLGANIAKMGIEHTAKALGLTKETGTSKAAGFFLTSRKINTSKGKVIGFIGDNTIALFLGVFASYLLTFTGRDKSLLKGLIIGNMSWNVFYGIISQFGATKVKTNDPNTHLISFISHSVFGITKAYLLTKIVDQGLYEPNFNSLGDPKENNGST